MPDFFDYEFYDRHENDDYHQICNSPSNLGNITNVSMLRHYINCWGKTPELLEYLGDITEENVTEITENCFGNIDISLIINDWEEAIERTKTSRKAQQEAEAKNTRLIEIMNQKRTTMCGIGTRLLKVRLNNLIKKGDKIAKLYRLVIEIEDINVRAKKRANTKYQAYAYTKKDAVIKELLDVCAEYVREGIDITYGKQEVDNPKTNYVVYFDLPNMEQVSFHTNLMWEEAKNVPDYEKEWDGKINSTLDKLEVTLNKTYNLAYPSTTLLKKNTKKALRLAAAQKETNNP